MKLMIELVVKPFLPSPSTFWAYQRAFAHLNFVHAKKLYKFERRWKNWVWCAKKKIKKDGYGDWKKRLRIILSREEYIIC